MYDATVPPPSVLSQVFDEAETSCIKCGFCLPTCPTYRLTGSESASPRGRIDLMQAVADGELEPKDMATELDFCLGCRACETVCPAGVEFGKLLEAGRAVVRARVPLPRLRRWMQWLALQVVLPSPRWVWLLASGLRLYQVSGLQWLVRAQGWLKRLAPEFAKFEEAFPEIPSLRVRQTVPSEVFPDADRNERESVAILTGCVMPEVLPQVNRATVQVLVANGHSVIAPPAQRCCGALHAHAGDLDQARQLARHNIAVFESTGAEWVGVNSAGCGAMMKEYDSLLAEDSSFAERAKAFSACVRDVSEILTAAPLQGNLQALPIRVAYDDPCHLLHGQNISEEPRALLHQIPQLDVVEIPENDWCCGSAGIYSLVHVDTAQTLLTRKLGYLMSVDPQMIVTGNPGCILQLRQGVKQCQLDIEVRHPVEVLAQAYTSSVSF